MLRSGEDGEARAALLAAGCLAVLNQDLADAALAEALETLVARRRAVAIDRLGAESLGSSRLPEVVAASPAMQRLLRLAGQVAESDLSILILGETGTGKEWLARWIHAHSPRAQGRFLAVNCAALPEHLIESELFGHVKGAFTGADRPRRGCFELAHQGVLLLDEIGEMPVHLQSRLLRALEDKEIRRLGSEEAVHVDVRIMSATSRGSSAAEARQLLRDDLFFRLAGVILEVPPLRERPEDVAALARGFLERRRAVRAAPSSSSTTTRWRRSPPTPGRATSAN